MMKKGIYAFLAVLTVFAMVMAGCDSGGGGGEDTYTVTFNTNGGSAVPSQTGLKSGDPVTRPSPSPTKEGFDFDGWYKEEALTNRWNFSNDSVTGNITLYAGWKADVGTTIDKIKINGIDFDTLVGADKGYPSETLADVEEGVFEPGRIQPNTGSTIEITTKTTGATATWAVKTAAPVDTDYGTTSPVTFSADNKLYIKVVNGENTSYYIIRVYFTTTATFNYGQPVIDKDNLDPLWTNYTGTTIDINRIATNEVTPKYKFTHTVDGAKAHTLGEAKAYWDDEGLYIYATITYHDYYEEGSSTPTARVTNMVGNYLSDSLEIMLNTRYQKFIADGTKALGQQFRVGFYTPDTGQDANAFSGKSDSSKKFVVGSGNHQGLPSGVVPNDILAAFRQSGQFYAWITKEGTKETGYKVLAKVPWYLIGYENTDQLFSPTTGQVIDNAKIGLDFQINTQTAATASSLPDRDGVLTWNSVTSQGVTDVTNYGVVTLARGTNPRIINANAPVIKTQPRIDGKNPANNTTQISVVADTGPRVPASVLSYKWYQADNATAAGTQVGTAATYTPPNVTAATGKFFYVEVTNTNNAATGIKTVTVTSNRFQYAEGPLIPADFEIPNPPIEGVGGATDTGGNKVFTLDSGSKGITYQFPTTPANLLTVYKTIQISYESTKPATDTKQAKVIVKQGYNSTETDVVGSTSQYQNINQPSGTITYSLTAFDTKKDGFTFQMNDNDAAASFTIKITKIVFTAD